ncbi:hypothetical protein DPMN_026601 [Dreissena polymorpha]|uniref:Uncharacterized protein n=1 Tax=Dreissena polymorpha TaxID=45954 RepID=A0A9D4LTQ3_DREPO|nr:hypothetical protein DPMN_026601 [Dreissena polymorpha]
MAKLRSHAQLYLERLDRVSSRYGHKISDTKTEWMLLSSKSEQTAKKSVEKVMRLRGKKLQPTDSVKYLGSSFIT